MGVGTAAASPTGSCPSHRKLPPPCPADLLEPLHQPGGQSWWDVEQKSLLLQLPQRRCEPEGQDPQWPHEGQARARPADRPASEGPAPNHTH